MSTEQTIMDCDAEDGLEAGRIRGDDGWLVPHPWSPFPQHPDCLARLNEVPGIRPAM